MLGCPAKGSRFTRVRGFNSALSTLSCSCVSILLSLTSRLLAVQMSDWIPREQEGWGQLRLGRGKNEGEIKKGLCAMSGCLCIWQGW